MSEEKKLLNHVKEYREKQLISKTELSREAEISLVTLDRIEKGYDCRLSTKRKLLQALGVEISDKVKIFPDMTESEEV